VGFISYVVIKLFAGRFRDVSVGAWFLAAIFIAKFALI
jgi:AGZA family xanthine/uracil permease-like MFS transporter